MVVIIFIAWIINKIGKEPKYKKLESDDPPKK